MSVTFTNTPTWHYTRGMKLVIIIPAYNEEKTIGKVLKSLPKKVAGISSVIKVVIDDGSTDKTARIARENGAIVLSHAVNLGLGGALATGLAAARKINADIALTFDADNQHSADDIYGMIVPILKNKADVTIGNRLSDKKNMPKIKILANWLANIYTYLLFGLYVHDSQSGLRGFSKIALSKIRINSTGYEVSSEIIGEIRRNNLILKEVKINTQYSRYSEKKGQEFLNAFNIITKIFQIKLFNK